MTLCPELRQLKPMRLPVFLRVLIRFLQFFRVYIDIQGCQSSVFVICVCSHSLITDPTDFLKKKNKHHVKENNCNLSANF